MSELRAEARSLIVRLVRRFEQLVAAAGAQREQIERRLVEIDAPPCNAADDGDVDDSFTQTPRAAA